MSGTGRTGRRMALALVLGAMTALALTPSPASAQSSNDTCQTAWLAVAAQGENGDAALERFLRRRTDCTKEAGLARERLGRRIDTLFEQTDGHVASARHADARTGLTRFLERFTEVLSEDARGELGAMRAELARMEKAHACATKGGGSAQTDPSCSVTLAVRNVADTCERDWKGVAAASDPRQLVTFKRDHSSCESHVARADRRLDEIAATCNSAALGDMAKGDPSGALSRLDGCLIAFSGIEPHARRLGTMRDTVQQAMLRQPPAPVEPVQPPPVEIAPSRPVPEPSPSWRLAQYDGLDFFGGDLRRLKTGSYRGCARACAGNRSCKLFTYNAQARLCFLKSTYTDAHRVPQASSGYFFRAASASQAPSVRTTWRVHIDGDLPGGDIEGLRTSNWNGCLAACTRTRGCLAVSFAPRVRRSDNCWLKGPGHGSPRRKRRIVAAERGDATMRPSDVTRMDR